MTSLELQPRRDLTRSATAKLRATSAGDAPKRRVGQVQHRIRQVHMIRQVGERAVNLEAHALRDREALAQAHRQVDRARTLDDAVAGSVSTFSEPSVAATVAVSVALPRRPAMLRKNDRIQTRIIRIRLRILASKAPTPGKAPEIELVMEGLGGATPLKASNPAPAPETGSSTVLRRNERRLAGPMRPCRWPP